MYEKKVYVCQFSDILGNNVFLPYTAGTLVSYLKSNSYILNTYDFEILFLKEDIGNLIRKIINPDYIFISCYVWNFKFSMEFAKQVKLIYPDCIIVAGGHHIPFNYGDFFFKHFYIDFIVHGEGESPLEQLLLGRYEYEINNLYFADYESIYKTRCDYKLCELKDIPSPYTTGVFDDIMKLPYNYTACLETNRGCPYGCAYCDWGSKMNSNKKLRFFDIDKAMKEIEWFGENKIEFVFGCDSNFGIMKSDMDFIDKFIEVKNNYGYPKKFRVCFAKNSDQLILKMNRKLNESGLCKGATLSFQSLSKDALVSVGRKNISLPKFKTLLNKYKKYDIPTYTELILGLPGETKDSFLDGLDSLLEAGQHSSLVIYNCQVYPNSEINTKSYREKYKLNTIKIPMYPTHITIGKDHFFEEEELIIGTNTMSENDFIDMNMYSWLFQTFHCLGLSQFISRYIRKNHNMSYKDFYKMLLNFAEMNPDTIIGQEYHKVLNIYKSLLEWNPLSYILPEYGTLNWPIEEGSFLNIMLEIDQFYHEIGFMIYKNWKDAFPIMELNKYMIKKPYKEGPFELNETMYKFLSENGYEIEDTILKVDNKNFASLEEYATETVWYGRKGGSCLYAISK